MLSDSRAVSITCILFLDFARFVISVTIQMIAIGRSV